MKVSELIVNSLRFQDILIKSADEVPVNVYVDDGLDCFLCFYVSEDDDWLVVAETTMAGTEEIRMIRKDRIIKISICYQPSLGGSASDEFKKSYI